MRRFVKGKLFNSRTNPVLELDVVRQIRARASVLGLVLASASIAGCASEAATPSDAKNKPGVTSSPLRGEGGVLVRLLERGSDATFHATYEVRRDATVEATIEVWQRRGEARADSSSAGSTTSVFTGKAGTVECTREASWICHRDATARGGVNEFVAQAVDDLRGLDVTASDATIAGLAARCFNVAEAGGVQICATEEGVPARMTSGGSTMELTKFDRSVSSADFRLPARVAN